ncbi:MAG: hypothetical protein WAM82_01400 [Thermoanaerobaculia bacterium]
MLLPTLVKQLIGNRPFFLASAAVLLLANNAAKAEDRKSDDALKPAWDWTVDERLVTRFSPQAMAARAAQHAAEERAFLSRFPEAADDYPETKGTGSPQQVTDSIDGDKTPELFLPFELFDHLLNMGLTSGANLESRTIIEQRAVALGFGRDLWKRLAIATAPYLELQREDERRAKAQLTHSLPVEGFAMDNDAIHYCRVRAQALAAAKAEFGTTPFLRLLYLGVTPGHSRSYIVKDGLAAHLRFIEGGCR